MLSSPRRTSLATDSKNATREWAIAVLVTLPFLWIYAVHFIFSHGNGTGFLDYDLPYYAAIGRAIFFRGNGILYPNPFDLHGQVIYFQWFPWLLGLGTAVLHLDPGYLMTALGILFAIGLSRITLSLVRTQCDTHSTLSLMLAMWGGGLICFGGILRALLHHAPLDWGQILQFEPGTVGLWFLNWGRNSIFTTEALYHILAGLLWLGVLSKRWPLAIISLVLITSTHPWTGAEMLAILGIYSIWVTIARRDKPPLWFYAAVVIVATLFGWYYGIYLNQFAAHRAIVAEWALPLVIHFPAYLLSISLPLLLVIARLAKRIAWTDRDTFLLIAFLVASALTLHQYVMKPVQPVHFDRGYPWLALLLLGLPMLPHLLTSLQASSVRWIAVTVILLIASSDNLFFLVSQTVDRSQNQHNITVSADERRAFHWLDQNPHAGLFLAHDKMLCYLASAYANVTPYLGHAFLTPNMPARTDTADRFYASTTDRVLPSEVRTILFVPSDSNAAMPPDWKPEYSNNGYRIYEK